MRFFSALCISLLLALLACEQETEATPQIEAVSTQETAPMHYWVNTLTTARFAPNHALRVPDPLRDEDMRNWRGDIYRGISVTVVESHQEWKKIIYDTDATGWVLESELTPHTPSSRATNLTPLKTFSSAGDDKAAELIIAQGTLLFVLDTQDDLSLVNYDGTKTAWVKTIQLTDEKAELHIAQSILKADWLAKDGSPNGRVMDKARVKFPQAKLLDKLANHIRFEDFNEFPSLPTLNVKIPKPSPPAP